MYCKNFDIEQMHSLGIGNTEICKIDGVFVKQEQTNLSGSVKDRAAFSMMCAAQKDGIIYRGAKVVEATSGNLGISLAALADFFGIEVTVVMPEDVPKERRSLIENYGGKVVLSPANEGMKGAISMAKRLKGASFRQFDNTANAAAHYFSTAEEIISQCGKVDFFVAGVGTGGTLSGTGRRLKEVFPQVNIVAVEPSSSAVLSGENSGKHRIYGIGAGFVPNVLDVSLISLVEKVSDDEAISETARLWRQGIFVGISSAANLLVAKRLLCRHKNSVVVTLFPDDGNRYRSVLQI